MILLKKFGGGGGGGLTDFDFSEGGCQKRGGSIFLGEGPVTLIETMGKLGPGPYAVIFRKIYFFYDNILYILVGNISKFVSKNDFIA